jgi:hypothetical protein
MNSITVAGYKDLFPKGNKTYDNFTKGIPSDVVVSFFVALNNELDSREERFELQERIYKAFTARFTLKQDQELFNAFRQFIPKTNGQYGGLIFGRRYLLELIAKEVNNYRECSDYEDHPVDEYNLFKAYLTIVDEINERDHIFINFKNLDKGNPSNKYRLLWLPILNQWEWNETVNLVFELFKLLCFLKYAKANYLEYLKEYLDALGFKTIGNLLSSFHQVTKLTYVEDKNALLKKLAYLNTSPSDNITHLSHLAINQRIGEEKVTISDVRKFPLYHKKGRGFMVIDRNTYFKKIYRGPFFELRTNTSLEKKQKFNEYSKSVSDDLEKQCLKPIIELFVGNASQVTHFDDGSANIPDAYVRLDNKIFLFEYKASFFPESITNSPNFDDIKAHIDLKFIKNQNDKAKGINQLKKQIDIIGEKGFHFDEDIKNKYENLLIYPIIVHQDFQFAMPGITDYLKTEFHEVIKEINGDILIKPLIMVDLAILFDIAFSGKDINYFELLIEKYDSYIAENINRFIKSGLQEDFLNSHVSFDQLYHTKLIKKSENPDSTHNFLTDLLRKAEISLDEFNKPL